MKIYILTHNYFKEKELSKYFNHIGLKTTHLEQKNQYENIDKNEDYICVTEQTRLISKKNNQQAVLSEFGEALHFSELTLEININNQFHKKNYNACVQGYIFPHLKNYDVQEEIYAWDDVFVPIKTMKSYHEMKKLGIKSSARDIAFSKMIDDLPQIFKFQDKINLNFNPVGLDDIISFEPVIEDLFKNNVYYRLAYDNEVFKPLIDYVIKDGLFIRRASNRKQKNYWLPGLNAGLPLTPKKDELHELTFMFHDIMHFIFPDLIVNDDSEESRHKYFITRMMSEAFTIILADVLFISLLEENKIQYDYEKRKIYPIFKNIKFDLTLENMPKIKEILWTNVQFALLGQENLKEMIKNDVAYENYKQKYQKIFQDDYNWTLHNYDNIVKNHLQNYKWLKMVDEDFPDILQGTKDFCMDFSLRLSRQEQVRLIFEQMYKKIENIVQYKKLPSPQFKKRALQRYWSGQMFIFFKYKALYNDIFMQALRLELKNECDMLKLQSLYENYLTRLCEDNFITSYELENYKKIYPFFEPFYVFYDRNPNESYEDTLKKVFKD